MIEDNRKEGKNVLEQAQLVMLRLLRIVDKICTENKLDYWLDSGTLLGAVRHGGFIPWDDDIDICMPRKDYNKFIELSKKELPSDVFLQNKETDPNYPLFFVKIRDNNSTIIERFEGDKDIKFHQGMFIDIFPVDFVSDIDSFRRDKSLFNKDFKHKQAVNLLDKIKKYLYKYYSEVYVKSIGKTSLFNRLYKKYKNSDGEYMSIGFELTYDLVLEKNKIYPLVKIQFCGFDFNAPNDYDAYLRKFYGDYMKMPEESHRVSHAEFLSPFEQCNKLKKENIIK